jgi:tetratricopeptide (TPR) repeat protein
MTFGRFSRATLLSITLGATGIGIPALNVPVCAQQADDRTMADELEAQGKLDQALPYLERLARDNPLDGAMLFRYGFALNVTSIQAKNPEERKRIRLKVRKLMLDAKAAGAQSPLLDSILQSIPEDGSGGVDVFSAVPEADKAMQEAEKAFSSGNFDTAIENYRKALKIDPTLYTAALYTGDGYFKKGYAMRADTPERAEAFKQAEVWFAKAIGINPDIETAYRYWGSVLLESNRLDEAKLKVVEAYITEPYNRLSTQGLIRWAQAAKTKIGHPNLNEPKTDIQPSQGKDGKTEININLDPRMFEKKDGRSVWLMFDLMRAGYATDMFKKEHPGESQYRHSLAEQVFAYKATIGSLREQLKKGELKEEKLDPGLKTLLEIDKAGLLEAYILLARADRGIAQDFEAYRKASRDKLRQYVLQFVIEKK